ncbi:hypothetical protein QJS10_CPA10g00166 [Acorus calamus]|uniref:Bacterial surface antigen (D15) domain-containing protein n=1 Tax=Acorus calamus TaxID=4465 RepID=A0AAV9E2Q9_ACOCL|nr:hypothetical protein QJS10_CPA10g00166 [Acorus calamus]
MAERNKGVRFVSSSTRVPLSRSLPPPPLPLFPSNLLFARQNLSSALQTAKHNLHRLITSFAQDIRRRQQPGLLRSGAAFLSLSQAAEANPPRHAHSRDRDEERVLISEVLIRDKDGEEMERKDLEAEAAAALKACRPNSALTVREVQEDVHRIINSGYFCSCMPVAVDTRDGIRLIFQVEPNQEFQGLICEGANVLPSKFLEDAFRDGYDTGKVDLVMNLVERVSGGFSAGGGISSGITNGPLSGLIGSFAYSHRNVFGRNQKLNLSVERGQIDSIFRINYTDPWIEGDDKRTSRSIMIQNSRTPGTIVHGNPQGDHGSVTIGRVTAGIEYSRPIRPKWSGTMGIIFQHAGARDDRGNPIIKDGHSCPLTASGNAYDDTLILKGEGVYTGSGDQGSPMFVINMEQGLPVLPEWLCFNRVSARARKGVGIGPARVVLSSPAVPCEPISIMDRLRVLYLLTVEVIWGPDRQFLVILLVHVKNLGVVMAMEQAFESIRLWALCDWSMLSMIRVQEDSISELVIETECIFALTHPLLTLQKVPQKQVNSPESTLSCGEDSPLLLY